MNTDESGPLEPPKTSWSPNRVPNIALVAVGLGVMVFAMISGDPAGSLLYGIAGFILLMTGALKLVRRPRLEVVDGDLALKGLTSLRYVPPSEVVEIRIIGIPRFGIRQNILRLEYSDEDDDNRLEVLSKSDLGVDPVTVAETLAQLGFPVRESDLRGETLETDEVHGDEAGGRD